VRKSDIISVSYTDHDPEHAEQVLRRFLVDYEELHLKAHATPGSYEFFRVQADDYKKRLVEVEDELSRLQTTEHVLDVAQQEDLIARAKQSAEAEMLAASASYDADVSSLRNAKATLGAIPSRIQTDSRSSPNQYSIERMRTALLELRNKRTDLLTNLLPDNRQVQDLDQQISDTSKSLAEAEREVSVENVTGANPLWQSMSGDIARLNIQEAADAARRSALQQQVRLYDEQLVHLATVQQQYRELQRTQKDLADSYNLYVSKREEASVSNALDEQKFANVSVVEPPLALHTPSQPKVWLDLVLGTALGVCLAIAGVLFKDSRSRGYSGVQPGGVRKTAFTDSVKTQAV
jgi:uncharacterized protein involved in exopolysaccharide biosynthesis